MKKIKKLDDYWIYKIGAVILALLFWLYVMQVQNPTVEQIYYVPLEARNLAENLVMTDQNIQIKVRVEGYQEDIENTSNKDIRAYADFTNISGIGEVSLQVLPLLPDGLELVSVEPSTLTIGLEEMQSEAFPISVEYKGSGAAYGYISLEPVLTPYEVLISGSSSALNQIDSVLVSVPMNNVNQNFVQVLPIEVRDINGELLNDQFNLDPATIDVFIPVVSDLPDKLLSLDVPVIGEPADGYILSRIVLEPEAIRVYGSLDILNGLQSITTTTVDISDAKDTITEDLTIFVPDDVEIADNEKTVKAVFVIEPVIKEKFNNLLIQNKNIAEGLKVKMETEYINVEVEGPESIVNKLDATDIISYIDCSGLAIGSYTLPVQIELPRNISR